MKISTIELRQITAEDNMVLTNGEAFSSVGGSIYLGVNDKAENWQEITAEEAEKRQAEMLPEENMIEEEIE